MAIFNEYYQPVCVFVSNEKKMDRVLQDHLGGMESVVEKQILGNILQQ